MPPTSAAALKNLQSYQASLQTPQQAADAANQALGVNAAQQQVSGLRGAIAKTTGLLQQVAPSVYGRSQNSLVTNAQATRQIANEQAPIAQNLDNQSREYDNASQDYRDLLGKSQAQAANTLAGQQAQLSFLQQIYQNLFGQEQAAEEKRRFDVQMAEAAKARAASSSGGGGGLNLGGLGSLFGGGSGGSAPAKASKPSLAGLQPIDAIARLFEGYKPGTKKGYTESVVIPELIPIIAGVLPGRSQADIKKQAEKLVYDYRKKKFGE